MEKRNEALEKMTRTDPDAELARELCTHHKCYGAESCSSCERIAKALRSVRQSENKANIKAILEEKVTWDGKNSEDEAYNLALDHAVIAVKARMKDEVKP